MVDLILFFGSIVTVIWAVVFFYPPTFWKAFPRFRPRNQIIRELFPFFLVLLVSPGIMLGIRIFTATEQAVVLVDGATVRCEFYPFSSRLLVSIDYNEAETLVERYELVLPSHLSDGLRFTVPGDGTVVVRSRGLPFAALFVKVPGQ